MRCRLGSAFVLVVVLVTGVCVAAPAHAGIAFADGPLAPVLERANKEHRRVFVEVWATWCGPCTRQRAEVFDTPDGDALVQETLAWRVDFDDPAFRPLMEQWAILSLPTVLVLKPDGKEVDRIEGYETRESFLAEAQRLVKGQDELPTLEKKLLLTRDTAERMRIKVEIAHKKLVRGESDAGLSLLERVITEDADGSAGAAEEALFLTGRYLSRVKRDFATGRHVWRELATRFPSGKYARTADWWYAGALHALHTKKAPLDDVAMDFLVRRARAKPDDATVDNVVGFGIEKANDRTTPKLLLDELDKKKALAPDVLAKQRARLADPKVEKSGS